MVPEPGLSHRGKRVVVSTRDTEVRGWYMDIVRELAVLPELKEEAG